MELLGQMVTMLNLFDGLLDCSTEWLYHFTSPLVIFKLFVFLGLGYNTVLFSIIYCK